MIRYLFLIIVMLFILSMVKSLIRSFKHKFLQRKIIRVGVKKDKLLSSNFSSVYDLNKETSDIIYEIFGLISRIDPELAGVPLNKRLSALASELSQLIISSKDKFEEIKHNIHIQNEVLNHEISKNNMNMHMSMSGCVSGTFREEYDDMYKLLGILDEILQYYVSSTYKINFGETY